jgi:ABC-2 type transport system ATP-binding protein
VATVPSLQLAGVDSGYNGVDVLRGINLSVTDPSIYVVLGPNGAGKTTLLRTIGGILEPHRGRVTFDGQDVYASRETRKRMSYLSHLNALPEEMTVRGALEFYASIEGGDVAAVMDMLDLGALAETKVSRLSQGQKKRASIGKTLLNDRDLYLLDEPTSNLDPTAAKEVRDLLLEFSKRKIVLYSSHNLFEAKEIGTFLILIRDGVLRFFDRIENLRTSAYRVGIKARGDVSKVVDAKLENGYFVLTVSSPEEVGEIVKKLVLEGIVVTEVKELDNPLEALFAEG